MFWSRQCWKWSSICSELSWGNVAMKHSQWSQLVQSQISTAQESRPEARIKLRNCRFSHVVVGSIIKCPRQIHRFIGWSHRSKVGSSVTRLETLSKFAVGEDSMGSYDFCPPTTFGSFVVPQPVFAVKSQSTSRISQYVKPSSETDVHTSLDLRLCLALQLVFSCWKELWLQVFLQ